MNFQDIRSKTKPGRNQSPGIFREFDATQLYCPKCREAMPVRKRLLLILPEGDKYEYRCAMCAESLGTKIDRQQQPPAIIL